MRSDKRNSISGDFFFNAPQESDWDVQFSGFLVVLLAIRTCLLDFCFLFLCASWSQLIIPQGRSRLLVIFCSLEIGEDFLGQVFLCPVKSFGFNQAEMLSRSLTHGRPMMHWNLFCSRSANRTFRQVWKKIHGRNLWSTLSRAVQLFFSVEEAAAKYWSR